MTAPLTRAQLAAAIAAGLPDNASGEISPAKIREAILNVVAAARLFEDALGALPELAAVALSGDYRDLGHQPAIPADLADLHNGPGFVTDQALAAALQALSIVNVGGLSAALAGKATPADIQTAIGALTAGSPDELNTFVEAYNRFLAGESALASLTGVVGGKLSKAANGADIADPAAFRANIGVGAGFSGAYADLAGKPTIPTNTTQLTNGAGFIAATDAAVTGKAPLVSPALTGTPTVPTAALGTSSTQAASTAFVAAAIQALVGLAPAELDTLKEIADRLASDETTAAALASTVAGKQASSAILSALAGVSAAASKVPYFTGASTMALLALGTGANALAQLDANGALRAYDASNLTNLPAAFAGRLVRGSNIQLEKADNGKLIECSIANAIQGVSAASVLGDKWFVDYKNTGTGYIALQLNGGETIDGRTTIRIYPKETVRICCDGSVFFTLGRRFGWIPLSEVNQAAFTVANLDFELGFDDAEFKDFQFIIDEMGIGPGDFPIAQYKVGGAYQTTNYFSAAIANSPTYNETGSNTGLRLGAPLASGDNLTGTFTVHNPQSTTTNYHRSVIVATQYTNNSITVTSCYRANGGQAVQGIRFRGYNSGPQRCSIRCLAYRGV